MAKHPLTVKEYMEKEEKVRANDAKDEVKCQDVLLNNANPSFSPPRIKNFDFYLTFFRVIDPEDP